MARQAYPDSSLPVAGYFQQSQRPLTCLALLLPLVGLYEIGTLVAQPAAAMHEHSRVVAFSLLQWFFGVFGATSFHLPALAVVSILVAWHALSGDPWIIHVPTTLGMAAESVLLAAPLLTLSRLISPAAAAAAPTGGWLEEVTLSLGASIYEELLFRLILISFLGMLFVDIAKLKRPTGYALAVVISSALFAGHHYRPLGNEAFDLGSFAFRSAAGMYLAAVFVLRGFGLAVGCHAAYDLAIVLLHP
jgi:hypothetical protein